MKLGASVPANNWKIIELYNKLKKNELDPRPSYQRKLVWKKAHKYRFIETILLNYPFPEVYIAPGVINTETLNIQDIIVDGQQRSTAIRNYIDGTDVFNSTRMPITKFRDLTEEEKKDFLNYDVSIRYLKNATIDQVKDIFERINSTEYSLNKTERINAQWGESEFVCFAKQIIEEDLDVEIDALIYVIADEKRDFFIQFFHERNHIFTDNDISRMLALQYILTLLATLIEGKYFRRNDKVQQYIEYYHDEFVGASEVEDVLFRTLQFIDNLNFDKSSYWFNKANIFTLICELYKVEVDNVDSVQFANALLELDKKSKYFNLGKSDEKAKELEGVEILENERQYFEYAREGVNEQTIRDYRGNFISEIIAKCTVK